MSPQRPYKHQLVSYREFKFPIRMKSFLIGWVDWGRINGTCCHSEVIILHFLNNVRKIYRICNVFKIVYVMK